MVKSLFRHRFDVLSSADATANVTVANNPTGYGKNTCLQSNPHYNVNDRFGAFNDDSDDQRIST